MIFYKISVIKEKNKKIGMRISSPAISIATITPSPLSSQPYASSPPIPFGIAVRGTGGKDVPPSESAACDGAEEENSRKDVHRRKSRDFARARAH
jgi:hypothetical protein